MEVLWQFDVGEPDWAMWRGVFWNWIASYQREGWIVDHSGLAAGVGQKQRGCGCGTVGECLSYSAQFLEGVWT